ncbi:branched-chain amino acid transport system II carrier protein, partial [Klebsiella pneumoniae]
FSFIVSNLGLTKLIQVSIPVLTAIYPPCIVLVALSFCIGLWHSATRILAPVMLVSLAFGVLDALKAAGLGQDFPQWLLHLPLAEQGLAWLIPSVATLAACSL